MWVYVSFVRIGHAGDQRYCTQGTWRRFWVKQHGFLQRLPNSALQRRAWLDASFFLSHMEPQKRWSTVLCDFKKLASPCIAV